MFSECLTQPSQMLLSPNQKMFSDFFFGISELYIKFGILSKKNDEPQRLFVSEIIDCKSRSYLNAQKATYQNTDGQWTC